MEMLLFLCLDKSIGSGWHGSEKKNWFLLGIISGGSYFPETYVRCSDIEYCVYFLASPEIWRIYLDEFSDKTKI